MTFWCASGHWTPLTFAAAAELPLTWDCHRCGGPAGLDPDTPAHPASAASFKTHLACVRDRRSDADADGILAEALAQLRAAA